MILYPAIDLRGGRCVRLTQGRFDQETQYETDPVAVAKRFAAAGATHLHVVDLDGARSAAQRQVELVLSIAKAAALCVQSGGGLREAAQVRELLKGGVQRAVIGSLAVKQPELVTALLAELGAERIVLALDVRVEGDVARVETQGWEGGAVTRLDEVLERYAGKARYVLCTDISRDGMLEGPNVGLYARLKKQHPGLAFIASGGVGALDDLRRLVDAGADGVVVGKALYEKRFTLEEALSSCSRAA